MILFWCTSKHSLIWKQEMEDKFQLSLLLALLDKHVNKDQYLTKRLNQHSFLRIQFADTFKDCRYQYSEDLSSSFKRIEKSKDIMWKRNLFSVVLFPPLRIWRVSDQSLFDGNTIHKFWWIWGVRNFIGNPQYWKNQKTSLTLEALEDNRAPKPIIIWRTIFMKKLGSIQLQVVFVRTWPLFFWMFNTDTRISKDSKWTKLGKKGDLGPL